MTFDEYQEKATATDLYPVGDITEGERVWLVEYRTLCVCGETGELANKVKKIRRDHGNVTDKVRDEISHEVGDILWYLSTLCTIVDLDLDEIAKQNIAMLSSRKKRDKITGAGDNR